MLGAVEATLVQMTEAKQYRDDVFAALGWYSEAPGVETKPPPTIPATTLLVLVTAAIFYMRYTKDERDLFDVVREEWPAARPELFERPEIVQSIEIAKLCNPPGGK
jgi:hypothetical protein